MMSRSHPPGAPYDPLWLSRLRSCWPSPGSTRDFVSGFMCRSSSRLTALSFSPSEHTHIEAGLPPARRAVHHVCIDARRGARSCQRPEGGPEGARRPRRAISPGAPIYQSVIGLRSTRLFQRRTEPNAVLIDNSDAARQISDKAGLRQESCEHGHYLRSGEVIWKA